MATRQGDKWVYQRKPRKCPECGSNKIADILYGLVNYSGAQQDHAAGKIAIGGCDVMDAWEGNLERTWSCAVCGVDLFRKGRSPWGGE
ncbi:hypothetical protein GCM10027098_28300 [Bowmanella dokdonensis]